MQCSVYFAFHDSVPRRPFPANVAGLAEVPRWGFGVRRTKWGWLPSARLLFPGLEGPDADGKEHGNFHFCVAVGLVAMGGIAADQGLFFPWKKLVGINIFFHFAF